MSKKRLMNRCENNDLTGFEDFYYVMAWNIESSLLIAGAEPGKDYSILDLYQLAQPFVLKQFNEDRVSFDVPR